MSRTNPYSDFSGAPYDRTAGVDTRDALVNNQAMETLRRVVWAMEYRNRPPVSAISAEPHLHRRFDRGGFALKHGHGLSAADLVLYAASSTELLSVLKATNRAALEAGESAPRQNGGTRTIYADPPGLEVSGIARWIPSNTRLIGFTFLDDVDVSGSTPAAVACVSGASFQVAGGSLPYPAVTYNFRPGDWLSLPSRTGGSTLRLLPIVTPSTAEWAPGTGLWYTNETVTDANGQTGNVLKTNIVFESCNFYGKLKMQYSHNCGAVACTFVNDDFNDYSGELELAGYASASTTYRDTSLYPYLMDCAFHHIGSAISAPMLTFTGQVTAPRMINCRVGSVKDLSAEAINLVSWEPALTTSHYGGVMLGCNFGGAAGSLSPKYKEVDWNGASPPQPYFFFTMCKAGKNGFPNTATDPKFNTLFDVAQ